MRGAITVLMLATTIAGCQSIPSNQSLGEYCAKPSRANEDVCKISVEIDGTRRQLSQTDIRVSDARAIAEEARAAALAALAREDQLFCETRTLQRTAVGSCAPGYRVMSCTQTRYTTRAGGPSIMRSINDQECRFDQKILEMQVRCCMAGAAAAPTEAATIAPQPAPKAQPQPRPTS